MDFSDDLPPQYTKVVKRSGSKRRVVKRREVKELVSTAIRAAHVARDKGYYIASPEAVKCVGILRLLRSLPLTPRLIIKADAFRTLQFLAKNGNPKIRSESKAVVDHWWSILKNETS
ncbi:unnamed protein product [Microthlaspi erraticum]|uniref:TFIIS N-terminal domain-containing protein n=1 Tax=Microthlaspi erraticum TaxID=1685480 RepID=A0A6D2ISI9_9BRAS|nr:unnamed protein product [Microthlaspi erraticum]